MEMQKENIVKAVEDMSDFPSELLRYLSAFMGVSYKWFDRADWSLMIHTFYMALASSPQVKLPITSPSNETSKEESWDYPARTWHIYSHILAKNYGWSLEYISQLQVEEALAKIQEITVDDQLDREFWHSLSELAYPYDKNTKTSKFVPLPRPSWMRPKIQPIKKSPIPRAMLPIGNIISDGVLPPEFMPKEIVH
jgi:hypothetical protein